MLCKLFRARASHIQVCSLGLLFLDGLEVIYELPAPPSHSIFIRCLDDPKQISPQGHIARGSWPLLSSRPSIIRYVRQKGNWPMPGVRCAFREDLLSDFPKADKGEGGLFADLRKSLEFDLSPVDEHPPAPDPTIGNCQAYGAETARTDLVRSSQPSSDCHRLVTM